jgi:WD40 repeat protein
VDPLVRVWDVDRGEEVRALKGHTTPVTGVSFSHDGQRLASASIDGTVKLWDVSSSTEGRQAGGEEVLTLKGHQSRTRGVCLSPDGLLLAAMSQDQPIKVWDARPAAARKDHREGPAGN